MSKRDIFTGEQTQRIIDWVENQYGERLEFLWAETPDCAIWRHRASKKWYGVIMKVQRAKITGQGEQKVEILDLRYQRDLLPDFLRYEQGAFPGWHMNKDNWLTVIFDEKWTDEKIENLITNSREIAANK
ncbi:MmcQ/YjbR family DNA-binding protein [bacterium]|nr:MmcQ/YjbR family DNA-binding protein [bacterium]